MMPMPVVESRNPEANRNGCNFFGGPATGYESPVVTGNIADSNAASIFAAATAGEGVVEDAVEKVEEIVIEEILCPNRRTPYSLICVESQSGAVLSRPARLVGQDVSGSECVPQLPAHRQAHSGGTILANAELRGLDHKILISKVGFLRADGFAGEDHVFRC